MKNHGVAKMHLRTRKAFTVLELLVTISIVALIASLAFPILARVREMARRTNCCNNLRNVGLAIHAHHSSSRRIPQAWKLSKENPTLAYGWATRTLSFIDSNSVAKLLDTHKQDGMQKLSSNIEAYSLPYFLCPSDITQPTFQLFWDDEDETEAMSGTLHTNNRKQSVILELPTSNYVGVYGTIESDAHEETETPSQITIGDGSIVNRPLRFADLRRGLSNTMIVGERSMAVLPSTWLAFDTRGEDSFDRVIGVAISAPNSVSDEEAEFSSRHSGGCNFLWADGSVSMVSNSVDQTVYRSSAQR